MEIKCFHNQVNSYNLVNIMRDFRIVNREGDGTYINISQNQAVNEEIKAVTELTNLDALYLTKTEVDVLFENCMLIDS